MQTTTGVKTPNIFSFLPFIALPLWKTSSEANVNVISFCFCFHKQSLKSYEASQQLTSHNSTYINTCALVCVCTTSSVRAYCLTTVQFELWLLIFLGCRLSATLINKVGQNLLIQNTHKRKYTYSYIYTSEHIHACLVRVCVWVRVQAYTDKCSKVFVSFSVRVLFLPPISPHAIDKHNFISTRDLLEGFYYFYMGRVVMFTCVCMRICVCVCLWARNCISKCISLRCACEWVENVRARARYRLRVCMCSVCICIRLKKKHITYVCISIKYSLLSHFVSFSLTLTQAFLRVSHLLLLLSHIHHMSPILFWFRSSLSIDLCIFNSKIRVYTFVLG